MSTSRRVALFGGTFDPVHLGHLHIAQLAYEQAHLDRVIFLPCQQSPHKSRTAQASAADRLEMLKLAATEPWMRVDDFELLRASPSYSYLTVQHFVAHSPETEWCWIMGCDQWQKLSTWKEPQYLAQHLKFLVFSRDDIPQPIAGFHMQHLLGTHPASSTALRDPRHTHHLDPEWLPTEVNQFIRSKGLYREIPFS